MKISKYIMAGVASVALAGVAHADVTINLTGSTAFRSVIHNAIRSAMTGAEIYAFTDANLGAANQAIFQGTIPGISGVTTVRTSWSGSAAGIQSVAQASNVNFLPLSTTMTTGGSAASAGTDPAVAKFAMSDVYQSSTIFTSPALQNTDVAVVPFVFIANDGAPSDLTNVTPQQFRALYVSGSLPLSVFTGDATDNSVLVYPTGRDGGSGTRITTLAETGYGIFTSVQQWTGVISGVNGTVNSLQLWPTTGAGSDPVTAGNGGYVSGSGVRDLMGCTSTNVTTLDQDGGEIATAQSLIILAYLGISDAGTAVGNGAKQLTYNGVGYSAANVQQGAYTFWGYQHLFNASGLTADEGTFKTALIAQIPGNVGSAGLLLNTMTVFRASDGGLVGP